MEASQKRQDVFELQDGRTIFKTHNGFKYFTQSKKGEVTEVTEEYWNQVYRNNVIKRKTKKS